MLPTSQASVMHPHQAAMCERVAVVLAQGTFGGSAHMGEDEVRCRLGGDSLQVCAIPRRDGRCEQAGRRSQLRIGVESYSETVGIVLASSGVLRWSNLVSHSSQSYT